MKLNTQQILACAVVLLLSSGVAFARNQVTRAGAQSSVNHNTNVNRNTNVNSNTNINRNVNVNNNVNVNRDVNVNVHGGYYGGGCCYHPVATAAVVTAAAVTTAAVIGSMVHTLPPACVVSMYGNIAYQNCGGVWYQPQFAGGSTTYVVVNRPY